MPTTTPKGASRTQPAPPPREKRPKLSRDGGGPIRSRSASAPEKPEEPSVNEEVANAVKRGYDIIAENIRQGRMAAERFREGDYRLREAPGDIENAAKKMLELARELSTSTFDVFDRMTRELGGAIVAAARERDEPLPPFRGAAAERDSSADASRLRLTPRCLGHLKAVGRVTTIERPQAMVGPGDLRVDRFMPPSGGSPITSVRFDVDLSREGLIAVVTVPPTHRPGVYTGKVYAKDQAAPLGEIALEIFK